MPITYPETVSGVPARAPKPSPVPQTEDPLVHLPRGRTLEFRKGDVIYGHEQASRYLYLVVEGRVAVSLVTSESRPVIVDIYQTDDLFNERAFVPFGTHPESAVALDHARVMDWEIAEVEELMIRKPRLGIALLQLVAQRSFDMAARIESFSVDTIPQRLARSLLVLSDRLGEKNPDGSIQMSPLTHEFLSQYVGTSREIITHHMNDFRRQGFLRYSRRGIELDRSARKEWFRTALAA